MMLNPTKSEVISVGTRVQAAAAAASGTVEIAGSQVPFSSDVKLLGVTIDSTVSFDKHISSVVRGCNYHLRALRHIRPLIPAGGPAQLSLLKHCIGYPLQRGSITK